MKCKNTNENHKNLCNKYGYIYTNNLSWGIYTRTARDMGFNDPNKTEIENVEDYFKNRKKQEAENLKIIKEKEDMKSICEKYNFPYGRNRISKFIKEANENNLSFEKYILNKIEKEDKENQIKKEKDEEVKNLLKSRNIDPKDKRIYLGHARRNNFNTDDEYQDLLNYFNFKDNEAEKDKIERKEIEKLLASRNLDPNSWIQFLTHASKLGFNNDSRLKNLQNYFYYLDNKRKIRQDKTNDYIKKVEDLINKYQIDTSWQSV